jgi:energy-coupling factor transport system permease protein
MFHTGAWVLWLIAAVVPAFMLRNPLYLVLVLGAAWSVYTALGRRTPIGSSWGSFVRVGVFLLVLTVLFNGLSVHVGQLVLLRLPSGWPIVGGPITVEALVAGAVNGLSLLTILVVFASFNAVVDHYQLLRATPSFLFQAAVVVSIAITFVPQMVLSAQEIREAQRIRGHRFRGIRDLLPLILPLLASSLERAIQLAETMEARGFGRTVAVLSPRQAIYSQVATLGGLLALLVGLFLITYFPEASFWGWLLLVPGVAGLLIVFWLQGRRVERTRYRRPSWTWRSLAVAGASLVSLAIILLVRFTRPEILIYSPYPPNSLLPPFDPLVGVALLPLALPALLEPADVAQGTQTMEQAP